MEIELTPKMLRAAADSALNFSPKTMCQNNWQDFNGVP